MRKKITIVLDTSKVKSKEHKHHCPHKWFKIYYYKKNKQTVAKVEDALPEVSSFKCYRYDTFYKVQSLSDKNEIFDYYRIRKPDTDRRVKNFAHEIKRKPTKKQKELTKVVLTEQDLHLKF